MRESSDNHPMAGQNHPIPGLPLTDLTDDGTITWCPADRWPRCASGSRSVRSLLHASHLVVESRSPRRSANDLQSMTPGLASERGSSLELEVVALNHHAALFELGESPAEM